MKKKRKRKKLTVEQVHGNRLLLMAVFLTLERSGRYGRGGTRSPRGESKAIRDARGRTVASCWYPSALEWRPCCDAIRMPSISFPNTLYTHCKTGRHVANLYGVHESDLRAAVRMIRPAMLTAQRVSGTPHLQYVRELLERTGVPLI